MRQLTKTALWPLLPKPWNAPDMEFHHGLWRGVSALYSQSGRQLGEESTRPFALNHHIRAKTIACKYEGSREGRMINMSALRTAMENFDEALAITKAVKTYYFSNAGHAEMIRLWDLYILSRSSIALIAYSVRARTHERGTLTVREALTSQYQFISGVFMICRHMMENADERMAQNQHISGQELYKYADSHDLFISFNGMACAGSTKKINEFLEICNAPLDEEEDQAEVLNSYVAQPALWYQYALATIELDCLIEQERMHRVSLDNSAQTYSNSAAIYEAVRRYVRRFMNAPRDDLVGTSFEIKALNRQNDILVILGRKGIRKIPTKHMSARLAE